MVLKDISKLAGVTVRDAEITDIQRVGQVKQGKARPVIAKIKTEKKNELSYPGILRPIFRAGA